MIDHLMPPERHLKVWMLISAFMYLLAGLAFVLAPDRVFDLINILARQLNLAAMPYPVEKFWLALSFSMMMTITTLSYMASRDVRGRRDAIVAVQVSKLVSSLTSLVFYFTAPPAAKFFGYLVIFITDGTILLITFVLFRRAKADR